VKIRQSGMKNIKKRGRRLGSNKATLMKELTTTHRGMRN